MLPELDHTVTAPPGHAAPSAPTVGLASGRQLGHFRIERPLGAGGMGEVYLATDLALDRPVAIKVLPDALAGDTVRRERLVREARAQARIVHPNVGHIYFIGEEAGFLYFAMELVNGVTLSERIAQGPLSIDEALDVVRGAALGLREAQRNGFTHRDIKPSNLMIDSHGMVKVLDFGLAAGGALDADGDTEGGVAQTSLAGTPLYMAPEQARGDRVDHRADIYALGATLYHLVAGKPPFVADSVEQLLSLHATAARPFTQAKTTRKRIAIDALCAKMMAPDPADRFATYDELLRALEIASTELTRPAGFWIRTLATGIDLVLFGLALAVVGLLIALLASVAGKSIDIDANGTISLGTLVLLSAALWSKWGRTPTQAIFELEVIDVTTLQPPRLRLALRRSLAKYSLLVIPAILAEAVEVAGFDPNPWVTLAMLLGMLVSFIALAEAAGRAGKRAPWDRIAGTLVRYRPSRRVTAARPAPPS